MPPAALLPKCERLQIARRQKELAWKAVAQPHLPLALLLCVSGAQNLNARGCLGAHTRCGFLDKQPHRTLYAGIGQRKRENMMSGKQKTQIERKLESEE